MPPDRYVDEKRNFSRLSLYTLDGQTDRQTDTTLLVAAVKASQSIFGQWMN